MPCVLPALSLKLAGLAGQAGAGRRELRAVFAATALGIVASFLVLALALAGLKASGRAIGWGIQLQQPAFLTFMAHLTAGFAASLFDWIHVGVPGRLADLGTHGRHSNRAQSFLTGALATLLATPCSAPFVGTAAGFALSRGASDVLAIFLCLGLGTSAWLLAVLSGVAGAAAAGSVTVAVAALLAFLGWPAGGVPFEARGRPRAAAVALAAAAVMVAVAPPRQADGSAPNGRGAPAFDPDAVAAVVARGGTVLVDVSAAWCLACKVNEIAALDGAEVRGRLARLGTLVVRADWTRPDPAGARYLASFGRYGVPLDVVYGPGRPTGEPLPELLTSGVVLAALDRAAGRP